MRHKRKERKTGNWGGEHCSSQAHLSNEVLGLVVSEAKPATPLHTHTRTHPTLPQYWHKSNISCNTMLSKAREGVLDAVDLASLSIAGGEEKIGSYLVTGD